MKRARCFVSGAAGFVGSHVVDRLLQRGDSVTAFDNLSTGFLENLAQAKKSDRFSFVQGDLLTPDPLTASMKGCDVVFHLAANADVRFGTEHPRKDLEQNTVATFNVLEAMRSNGVQKIVFSSTGSVYGEAPVFPTPETCPFPVQTSLYGASKVAGESMISAYAEGYGFQGWIFRFVSVLGERYSHGHVFDFYKKLLKNPRELEILGNGKQRKSYMYVQDCIDAVFLAMEKANDKVNIFNLGVDHYCEVNDSVGWITRHLGLTPRLVYTGGDRGWIGDNPFIFLDCAKVRALGWSPALTIQQGIIRTLDYLMKESRLMEQRH